MTLFKILWVYHFCCFENSNHRFSHYRLTLLCLRTINTHTARCQRVASEQTISKSALCSCSYLFSCSRSSPTPHCTVRDCVEGEPILFSLVEVGKMLFPIINCCCSSDCAFYVITFSLFTSTSHKAGRGLGNSSSGGT